MTKTPADTEAPSEVSYREAMREAIAAQWAAVWKAIPAVIDSDDPDAVHRVRVASRRLRAAMDVAPACFPPKWYRPLHKTSKAITRSLGEVRDRDVLLDALTREREQASAAERPGIDHMIAGVRRERKRERKKMLRFLLTLESEKIPKETKRRFSRSKDRKRGKGKAKTDVAGKDQTPRDSRETILSLDPEASLATNARRVLAVRVNELFAYSFNIPAATETELLHDARIATKRLRYTLELFPGVFGEEGAHAIAQLQALQEELGHLHDHDVRIERIEEEAARLGEQPATAELRASLQGLLDREKGIRATQHGAVVACWQAMEREGLQESLLALTAPVD